jgi:hypothetical protein
MHHLSPVNAEVLQMPPRNLRSCGKARRSCLPRSTPQSGVSTSRLRALGRRPRSSLRCPTDKSRRPGSHKRVQIFSPLSSLAQTWCGAPKQSASVSQGEQNSRFRQTLRTRPSSPHWYGFAGPIWLRGTHAGSTCCPRSHKRLRRTRGQCSRSKNPRHRQHHFRNRSCSRRPSRPLPRRCTRSRLRTQNPAGSWCTACPARAELRP